MIVLILLVVFTAIIARYPYQVGCIIPYVAIVAVIAVAVKMRKGMS